MKKSPHNEGHDHSRDPKSRSSREDDLEIWRHATKNVTPLIQNKKTSTSPDSAIPPPRQRKTALSRKASATDALISPPKPAAPALSHGRAPGMERADRLRMRRGKLTIEARLDLHGMTRDQAHGALIDFLDRARERGRRTVLVITGKGSGPGSPRGILREAVPRWLNETPARTWIKGFGYAAPADGGEGALYVLLKRKRS